MKRKVYLYLPVLWLAILALHLAAHAQPTDPPFWNEIKAYKQQDSVQMPPKNAVLFVGSSSIRLWENMQEMFPEHTVINRGFGGSNLLDLKRYLNEIVFPYQPKQIVIYSGENDIASDTVQAQEVLLRFQSVFQEIRKEMPHVPVLFISIKPSPSRLKYKPVMEEANRLIREYIKKQPEARYVDVYTQMLRSDGKPKTDIYVQDSLHMNQKGYQIWKEEITPYLIR